MSLTKEDLEQIRAVVTEVVEPRFAAVDLRFDAHDKRFDVMDAKFTAMDARMDGMDLRFDAMDTKITSMDSKIMSMDAKFEAKFAALDAKIDEVKEDFTVTMTTFADAIISQLQALYEDMAVVKDYVKEQQFRMAKFELRLAKVEQEGRWSRQA